MLIPYTVAVLGGEVEVPTLTGTEELKVPKGTPSGKILKIKEQGVPLYGMSERRGDQYVKVDIEVPAKLSKHEQELLEQLAAERKEKIQAKKGLF